MKALFDAIWRHARERPDAPALVHEGVVVESWTSLVAAVGRRAAGLRQAEVGPGTRVLLLRAAGPQWVVDALSTWMLGAAIVPLDPALPMPRRQDLARRSGAMCRLGPPLGLGLASPRDVAGGTVTVDASPGRLAWLIFSSGSTGAPKGVCVGRGGYAAVLAAQVAALKLTSADRCAWLLSPGFDASLSDVGVALLAGAGWFSYTGGPRG